MAFPTARDALYGNPPAADHQPDKAVFRQYLEGLEVMAGAGAIKGFASTVADLPPSGNTLGDLRIVLTDPTVDGGVYLWDGTEWSLDATLPTIYWDDAYARLAQAWAEGTEPGGPGTKSAKEHSADAGAFAVLTAADALATAANLAQTTLDRAAAAASATAASLSEQQSQAAAVLAGAPIAPAFPTDDTETAALASPFLFIAPEGVQSWTHSGTVASLVQGNYASRVEFNDVPAVRAHNGQALPVGLIIDTRRERFSYEVVSGGEHVTNDGGDKLKVLVGSNGKLPGDAFFAAGDGTTDDSAAVQAAFDAASDLLTLPDPPSGTNSRPWVALSWSRKHYYCATPVTLPTHINVDLNGATFSAPAGGRIFNGDPDAYRWNWVGPVVFWGDDVEAIYLDGNNLNNAWFQFSDIDLSTQTRTIGKWGIYIKSRSSRVMFNNVNDRLCQFAFRTNSDFTYFNGGWWSGHVGTNPKPGGQGSARFDGNDVILRDIVAIPEPQGVTRADAARWIDSYGAKIHMDGCHFGAENAGVPIIYQFASATYDATARAMSTIITATNCQLASGSASRPDAGVVVLQGGVLPGTIKLNGCEGLAYAPIINAHGYDPTGTEASQNTALRAALQAATAAYRGALEITVDAAAWQRDSISAFSGTARALLPRSLAGYVLYPRKARSAHLISPAMATALPIIEICNPQAGVTGLRQWNTYVVRVVLHRGVDLATADMQVKEYRVSVLTSSTSALLVFVDTKSFYEKGRVIGNQVGDVIIALALTGTPTSTVAQLALTLAELTPSEQYPSVEVSIVEEASGGNSVSRLNQFASLYPVQ